MNKEIEIWKDIPEYETHYQVSNLGRVRSKTREIRHTSGGIAIRKGRMVRPGIQPLGYHFVYLSKDNERRRFLVHRLVYQSFVGELDNRLVIDHIDHDPTNNLPSNLRQVTTRQNLSNRKKQGTSKYIGVWWDKNRNKWAAGINIDGRLNYLGRYKNEVDASTAYQNALNLLRYRLSFLDHLSTIKKSPGLLRGPTLEHV